MTVCFIQLAQAVKIAGLSLSVNFQTEETTIGEQVITYADCRQQSLLWYSTV